MDRIYISDLLARGIIGTEPGERQKPQDILINVVVFTDTRRAAASDSLEDCVDYRLLARKLQAHAESAARFTVEALANDLAGICLASPGVMKAQVRVEKPSAVRFSRSVGAEVERENGA
jgi:FolB domain-containing protein